MSEQATGASNGFSNLVPWDKWLKDIGLDRSTGYRYRKRGLLAVVNVFGRLYITRDEILRFESRALAGEFALRSSTPVRRRELSHTPAAV